MTVEKPKGYEKYSTATELAQFLGITKRTLLRWLADGKIVGPAVKGNLNLWSPEQRIAIRNIHMKRRLR